MKTVIILLAALVPVLAQAQSANALSGSNSVSDSTSVSGAVSANVNTNGASNTTNTTTTTASTALQGNAQNITFNSNGGGTTRYEGTYTVKSAPSIALAPAYPTAPCMGSTSIGGSGIGFSIGVGSSWTDKECGIRETARVFHSFGLQNDAIAILCQSEFAKTAAVCMPVKTEPVATAPK